MKRCHNTSGDYRDICHGNGVEGPVHRRRGIAMIWTAAFLLILIGIVGLSIDWGKMAWNVHELNNAADAAAMAGAMIVKAHPTEAITLAAATAALNETEHLPVVLRTTMQPEPFDGDETSLDILLGRWVGYNRTFVATLDAPNAVRVIARRMDGLGTDAPPLAMLFGPVFDTDTVDVVREAVAWCSDSGGSGLICLSEAAQPGLYVSGTADLDIDNGGIHVNSGFEGNNSDAASWISGNALLDCGFINVVGEIDPPPDSTAWESIFEGGDEDVHGFSVVDRRIADVEPVEDPIAATMEAINDPYVVENHLDLPDLIDNGTIRTIDIPTVTATATLEPGYYPNGISLTTAGEIIKLVPTTDPVLGKLFIFGGGPKDTGKCGLYADGGRLEGYGVTCYVTQNFSTGVCGVTRLMGNAQIDLWSPGDWQNHQSQTPDPSLVQGLNGIAVWQDPNMIDPKTGLPPEVHLNGGSDFIIAGTLYFPNPIHITLNGNLGQAGNQILCGSASILGKAVINVNYDQRNDAWPSKRSYLVK